jgi:hypothetical protein
VWIAAGALRAWGLPPAAVAAVAAVTALLCSVALVRAAPMLFLGSDGLWMLEALGSYLPRRFGWHRSAGTQRARRDATVTPTASTTPPASPADVGHAGALR